MVDFELVPGSEWERVMIDEDRKDEGGGRISRRKPFVSRRIITSRENRQKTDRPADYVHAAAYYILLGLVRVFSDGWAIYLLRRERERKNKVKANFSKKLLLASAHLGFGKKKQAFL